MSDIEPESEISVAETIGVTPDEVVREHLRKSPITMTAWDVKHYLEAEENISEEFLQQSLDKLKETEPEFEKNHRELIENLEKNALMVVPLLRKIPIMTLLEILDQSSALPESFAFLPDFPKSPAPNLVEFIYPNTTLSREEKLAEYEKIAHLTPKILGFLKGWRNQVQGYINGLEGFEKTYADDLNEAQKERIEMLIGNSRRIMPNIEKKIQQKILESDAESEEFERFHRIVCREPKYQMMQDPDVARAQIQVLFDESNRELRAIIAKMADAEEILEHDVPEEEEEEIPTARRGQNGQRKTAVLKRPTSAPSTSTTTSASISAQPSTSNGTKRRRSVRFESPSA